MSESLFLKSLEIRQFRAFDYLKIERLGRVNLIVGKNNVGKSSLLEALWLYAYQGHAEVFWKILELRDEGSGPERTAKLFQPGREDVEPEDYDEVIKRLFHQGTKSEPMYTAIIGPVDSADSDYLVIKRGMEPDSRTSVNWPAIKTKFKGRSSSYRLDVGSYRLRDRNNGNHCVVVFANGLESKNIEKFWDAIALTNLEDDVLKALRIIAKDIERINLVAGRKRLSGRIPVVKVSGVKDPIPLRSLGEGMNRMFGIALALVTAKDGVLLIDEIESGLHYSIQANVWRLIFEVARRLNVQVFTTTHSWDCLIAFQEAAKESEQDEGVLIRLLERKGHIVADLFDEEDLDVVSREGIEVR